MTGVLYKKRKMPYEDKDTSRCHVTAEAEAGVCGLKPRKAEDQRPPPEAGRGEKGHSRPESRRKQDPANTLIVNF